MIGDRRLPVPEASASQNASRNLPKRADKAANVRQYELSHKREKKNERTTAAADELWVQQNH